MFGYKSVELRTSGSDIDSYGQFRREIALNRYEKCLFMALHLKTFNALIGLLFMT